MLRLLWAHHRELNIKDNNLTRCTYHDSARTLRTKEWMKTSDLSIT